MQVDTTSQYMQALEWQGEILRWFQARPNLEWLEQWSWTSRRVRTVIEALLTAQPYYFAAHMQDILLTSFPSFPADQPLRPEHLHTQAGFCYFQAPGLALAPSMEHPENLPFSDMHISAMAWKHYVLDVHADGARDLPGVQIVYFAHPDLGTRWSPYMLVPVGRVNWSYGKEGARIVEDSGREQEHRDALSQDSALEEWHYQIFGALQALLQQRLLITPQRRVSRGVMRRAQKLGIRAEPVVNIIELRTRQYLPNPDAEHYAVEWGTRWWVRTHWHKYHTTEGLVSRLLTPYVKGPEHLPLKEPKTSIFAVVN